MPLNILLIDDCPTFLRSLRQFLTSLPALLTRLVSHAGAVRRNDPTWLDANLPI